MIQEAQEQIFYHDSVRQKVLEWSRQSGRFAEDQDPSPIMVIHEVRVNLLYDRKWNYKNFDGFKQRWETLRPHFEESEPFLSMQKWVLQMQRSMGTSNPQPLDTIAIEMLLRRDSTARMLQTAKISPPPMDFYDFRQARHAFNQRYTLSEKELRDILSFTREYSARKKVLSFEQIQSAGFSVLSIKESKSSNSCYFEVAESRLPIRLADHWRPHRRLCLGSLFYHTSAAKNAERLATMFAKTLQ